tara:strand:- start:423 stop:2627 length:2205 start_codon:yes stop_codon:yes gene_type:complete
MAKDKDKNLFDEQVKVFRLEKEKVAQQRAILEQQRKSLEKQKEVNEAFSGMGEKVTGEFASVVSKLAKVNKDMAISVINQKKSTEGTFEAFLTNRKFVNKSKEIANDPELNRISQLLEQAKFDQQKEIEKNTEIFQKRNEIEKLALERDKSKDTDKRTELQEKIRKEESEIQSIETNIKDIHVDRIEKLQEEEEEVRKKLNQELEKSQKSEGYSKFTDGIKELSGGMIDIGDILDTGVKKIEALGNVAQGLMTPFVKVKDGIMNTSRSIISAMKGETDDKDELADKTKKLSETVAEGTRTNKKENKNLIGRMLKLGIVTIALIAAFMFLREKFQAFADWWDSWFGKKTPSQKVNFDNRTAAFEKAMRGAITQERKDELLDDYEKDVKAYLESQGQRIDELDDRKRAEMINQTAGAYFVAQRQISNNMKARIGTGTIIDDVKVAVEETDTRPNRKTDPSKKDQRYKNRATVGDKIKAGSTTAATSTGNRLFSWANKWGGKIAWPVATVLTGKQIYDALVMADDVEAELIRLAEEGQITQQQFYAAIPLVERMRIDKGFTEPITSLAAGGIAAAYTHTATQGLYAGGWTTGWIPPLASLVVGGGTSMLTSMGLDWWNDSDEKLFELLNNADSGIDLNDPDMARKHYEEMNKKYEELTGVKLYELTPELIEVLNPLAAGMNYYDFEKGGPGNLMNMNNQNNVHNNNTFEVHTGSGATNNDEVLRMLYLQDLAGGLNR